ncbi:MAG: VTT domain-containing protein [Methylomicrobium sp.]
MTEKLLELSGLFISAFVSATIAPGGSEAVLAWMLSEGSYQPSLLVGMATIGNTLGALTTWYLGRLAAKKYPLESLLTEKKRHAIESVKKWGIWALLFSWLPIIGDGFCFAGGWLRFSLGMSVILIFVGKLFRYTAISIIIVGM